MSLKVKVVFAAAVALLAAAVSAQVVNGDFSKVGAGGRPEGWQVERIGKAPDGIAVDTEVYRSPKGALRLKSNHTVLQDIKLKPR